jgi:hercynine metabolism protein
MSGNWLEELEQRLEQHLESFLRANPEQEQLLAAQEARDRQQRLLRERRRLRDEAEQQRQALLALAGEIRCWQERVQRARRAGADDLALRAEAHVASLMDRGRERWRVLGELGARFREVEEELTNLRSGAGNGPRSSGKDLETAWAEFEAAQELRDLRRRMQL